MKYVIKIGTSSLFNENGRVKEDVLSNILKTIRELKENGNDVVLVVSGAVACGKAKIRKIVKLIEKDDIDNVMYNKYKHLLNIINDANNKKGSITTIEKSVIAGIGQNEMMKIIQNKAFSYGILTEQMLVSGRADLKRSTAIKNINKCFENGILAVVNANDTVYEEELADEGNEKFSDNDTLASDIARTINADRLFLITNVEGYLDKTGKVVKEITINNGNHYLKQTKQTKSSVGTGGMYSKLQNALSFAKIGGISHIISVNNISYIKDIAELRIHAGTRICKNLGQTDFVKELFTKQIDSINMIYTENSSEMI